MDICSTALLDIPPAYASVTESLCNAYDAVCDSSRDSGGLPTSWRGNFTYGGQVHGSYATDPMAQTMGSSITNIAGMS